MVYLVRQTPGCIDTVSFHYYADYILLLVCFFYCYATPYYATHLLHVVTTVSIACLFIFLNTAHNNKVHFLFTKRYNDIVSDLHLSLIEVSNYSYVLFFFAPFVPNVLP